MPRHAPFVSLISLALLTLLCTSGGCIVRDIRDSLYAANTQLDDVDRSLQKLNTVNQSLVLSNQALENVNTRLAAVDQGLIAINAGQENLQQRLDSQLKTLKSIDQSLARLDRHLASLRETITTLDSAIPFFDLGSSELPPLPMPAAPDPDADRAPAAAPNPDAAAPEPDAPPAAAPTAASPASDSAPRREALLGTWISQYPLRDLALIIAPDGRYMLITRSGEAREEGSWTRADPRTLRLTPDAPPPPPPPTAPANQPAVGRPSPPPPPPPPVPRSIEVLAQSRGSFTCELDGRVVIFSRP